jgi:hypothetical protein
MSKQFQHRLISLLFLLYFTPLPTIALQTNPAPPAPIGDPLPVNPSSP